MASGATQEGGQARMAWALPLLVALAIALVWSPALGGGYVWDDRNLFTESTALWQPGALWSSFTQDFWDTSLSSGYYRPLITASYIADGWLWSLEQPGGWHATNVLAHALVAGGLCALLQRLGMSVAGAGMAALLFGLFPTSTESVAWISGRTDVFAAGGAILSLLADRQRRPLAAALFLAVALLCKETTVLVPGMAMLLSWSTGAPLRTALRQRAGMGVVLIAYVAVRMIIFGGSAGMVLDGDLQSTTLGVRLAALPHLIGLVLMPGQARIEYGQNLVAAPLLPSALAGGLLIAVMSWRSWATQDRIAAALLACAGLALLPSLGAVVLRGVLGARFSYLPAAFLLPAAVWLARGCSWRPAILVTWATAWCIGVWLRVPLWESEATLFAAAAAQPPVSPRVNLNLGIALYDDGQWPEARERLQQSAEETGHAKALYMLGLMYEAVGCDDLALDFWRDAVARDPSQAVAANNLGALLRELGAREASLAVLDAAIAQSRHPNPLLATNRVLSVRQDRPSRPMQRCTDPNVLDRMVLDPVFLNTRALNRLQARRFNQAERLILAALHASPGMVGAQLNRAQLYLMTNRQPAALALLVSLQEASPGDARIGRLLQQARAMEPAPTGTRQAHDSPSSPAP